MDLIIEIAMTQKAIFLNRFRNIKKGQGKVLVQSLRARTRDNIFSIRQKMTIK